MSAPAFTPGPWQIAGCRGKIVSGKRTFVYHGIGPDGVELAAVWFDERSGEGWKDARLIAAAPDVFEALAKFVEHCTFDTLCKGDNLDNLFGDAKAALAKARGETA